MERAMLLEAETRHRDVWKYFTHSHSTLSSAPPPPMVRLPCTCCVLSTVLLYRLVHLGGGQKFQIIPGLVGLEDGLG